jgi:integrase
LADEQDAVLGVASGSLDVLWRKARKAALVDDLHFHDSRRAALTKMARVFSVMELARISGHRDLRILQNVYYAPDMDELAKKLR